MDLKNIDINDIDFSNAGNWPWAGKIAALIIVFGAVLFAGWYFDVSDQRTTLEKRIATEAELKKEFELKQKRAANLDAYEAQLEEMRESFGAMLRQLPSKAEVSKLLDDITQTGLSAGLEFDLFQPQSENKKEFYAELPVAIEVRGSYHELARFVSGVANLPRIVTLHGITIQPNDDADDLNMSATAKTYRYLEDEER